MRCKRRKSPYTNPYRAFVSSLAPSVSPRCQSAYSSHECESRNAFSAAASGCKSPQLLLSTYWRDSISRRACATARSLTLYDAMAAHCDPRGPSEAPARRAVGLGGRDAEDRVGREPEQMPRRRAGAGRAVRRGERLALHLHGPAALAVDRSYRLERRRVDDASSVSLDDQVD